MALTAAAGVTASVNTAIGGTIVIVPVSLTSSGRAAGSVTWHISGIFMICFSGSVAVIVSEEAGHLAMASCVYWEPSVGCWHAVMICGGEISNASASDCDSEGVGAVVSARCMSWACDDSILLWPSTCRCSECIVS